ncbi:MAG: SWIM zinc finger family protein, partial [Nocardioidaceae bacterium]|nr:SWIM zinc finger family protein [Nocardioidaceae bacterium]
MVDLTLMLDDADLRRRFGTVTLERAENYVATGQVLSVTHSVDGEGDLDVRGQVAGSTAVPYQTYVAVGLAERGLWVYSRCSCPVGDACKHALALLLTVRLEQEAASEQAGSRRWERQLAHVLDELDQRIDGDEQTVRPLALQIELKSSSPASRHRWEGDPRPQRGSLRVRPLQRGARDNWVKSGVSWQDVPYLATRRGSAPAQASVLGEMLAAYRAASRQTYFGSESHLPLGAFGPSLWSLLTRAADVGLVLVPGHGIDSIHVEPSPVAVELDVNTSASAEAHLRLGVRLGEDWYGAAELDVLGDGGEGGHGVALWSPTDHPSAQALTLASLAGPVGPEVRRLLAVGESLVVPASDRADLLTDYLPRLQRHVSVTSSDGSVVLPEPAVPRLALTVTWVSVDEVRIVWSWRYQVGADDREYSLDEMRGMRGFRRPDLEREQLTALDLDEQSVHRLCDSHRRERGLVPQRVFTGTDAISFSEDVLPGLVQGGQVEITEIGSQPDYR